MRGMLACLPLIALAWMTASPPPAAPHPVRVADVKWCRMPEGWGSGAALLVRFEVERSWHMYWMNPGDSGAPPVAKAALPAGWKLGQPIWPRPRVQQTDGETVLVHEGTWGWILPVESETSGQSPDFPVQLDLNWMVCRQTCTVGKTSVQVAAPSGTLPACPAEVGGTPFPLRPQADDRVTVQAGSLRLQCQARGRMSAQFIQATDPGVQLVQGTLAQAQVREGVATLDAPLRVRAQDADGHALAIRGLLLLGDRPGDPCIWIEQGLPVPGNAGGSPP